MKDKKTDYKSVFDDSLSTPPAWALRTIQAGRLKGKSDINPQWRIEAMTAKYGTCGIGWYFKNVGHTFQEGAFGEMFVFAEVQVFIRDGENWSMPVSGTGGSMIIQKEKNGLYNQDEGVKMAYTDALSVALKFFGVGSKVYCGQIDNISGEDTKYTAQQPVAQPAPLVKLSEQCETEMWDCKTIPELDACGGKWAKIESRASVEALYRDIKKTIIEKAKPTTEQIVGDLLPANM